MLQKIKKRIKIEVTSLKTAIEII